MAETTLQADSASENPRTLDERLGAFRLCNTSPLLDYRSRSSALPDLRGAYALTLLLSAASESGALDDMSNKVVSDGLDAIAGMIAMAAFKVEDAGNA